MTQEREAKILPLLAAAAGIGFAVHLLLGGEPARVDPATVEQASSEEEMVEFSMTNYGTKVSQEGNCTYTVNATIAGEVDGNTIEGTVVYRPAITDNPDCAALDCQTEQAYGGSRPP